MKKKHFYLNIFACIICGSHVLFSDKLLPSQQPPGGLKPKQVPQFVSIGFDDNSYAGLENSGNEGGMKWAYDFFNPLKNPEGALQKETFDGTPARVSFFVTSCYISSNPSSEKSIYNLQWILNATYKDGHEMANHSWNHTTFTGTSYDEWVSQMQRCRDDLVKPAPPDSTVGKLGFDFSYGAGVKKGEIVGFRTPFLRCNDNTFKALQVLSFLYDCSLEEGFQDSLTGKNFFWPYTMDEGSPGNDFLVASGTEKMPIGKWPGVWEMPAYAVVSPSDEECPRYGVAPGFRKRIAHYRGVSEAAAAKITGLDYNLWLDKANGGVHLTKNQCIAVLNYTLDQRLEGNRAPLLLGAHSDIYNSEYQRLNGSKMAAALRERQEAIEEFVKYALSKPDVRVVPFKDIIAWCRNPVPLKATGITGDHVISLLPVVDITIRGRDVAILFTKRISDNIQLLLIDVRGRLIAGSIRQGADNKRISWRIDDTVNSGMYLLVVKVRQRTYSVKTVIE